MDNNSSLQLGIAALKAGNKDQARTYLLKAVQQEPNNEQAWGWLSNLSTNNNERAYCLREVLRINPGNEQAKKMLAGIPVITPKAASPSRKFNLLSPKMMMIGAAVIVVVLVVVGISWAMNNVGTDTFLGHPLGDSWNNLTSEDQGGVTVTIPRLVVFYKSSLTPKEQKWYNASNAFYNTSTICELYIIATNSTGGIMSIYPDQGLLVANGEQVQLMKYSFYTSGTMGGQIFPGATINGEITFGLTNVNPDTITSMTITFNAPHDEYFLSYGDRYVISLDLSHHEWVDKPQNLMP